MDTREIVIAGGLAWQEMTGLAPSTLSHRIMKNGTWFDNLQKGADITTRVSNRAIAFLEESGINIQEIQNQNTASQEGGSTPT